MKKIIIAAIVASIGIVSCQKNDESPTSKPTSTTTKPTAKRETDPDEAKYDDMIDVATYGLMDLRSNTQFVNLVHSKVDLKFDGDDNVLLKTLSDACADLGIDLKAEMTSSLNNHEHGNLANLVDEAINGFSYGDETEYLQVYIPYNDRVERGSSPALGANRNEGTIIKGFDFDGTEITIDSVYAIAHETWVLSVNETVDNSGTPPPHVITNRGSAENDHTILIKGLYVDDLKEDFPNGRSEIMYVEYRSGPGSCNNGPQRMVNIWAFNQKGYRACDETDEAWVAPITWPFSPTFSVPFGLWNEKISLLFYEKDERKKFNREVWVVPGCSNTAVGFRSEEDPYGIQVINNPWVNGGHYSQEIDNSSGLTSLTVREKFN